MGDSKTSLAEVEANRRGAADSIVRGLWSELEDAFNDFQPVKTVWKRMRKEGRLTVCYTAFLEAVGDRARGLIKVGQLGKLDPLVAMRLAKQGQKPPRSRPRRTDARAPVASGVRVLQQQKLRSGPGLEEEEVPPIRKEYVAPRTRKGRDDSIL